MGDTAFGPGSLRYRAGDTGQVQVLGSSTGCETLVGSDYGAPVLHNAGTPEDPSGDSNVYDNGTPDDSSDDLVVFTRATRHR